MPTPRRPIRKDYQPLPLFPDLVSQVPERSYPKLLPFVLKEEPFAPRYYQQEAMEQWFSAYERGLRATAIELPTGAGKMVLLAMCARRILQAHQGTGHVVVLVPWLYLVRQTLEEFVGWFHHSDLGIIQGKHNDRGRRITIASIDTLSELHRLRQYYQSLSEPLRAIFIDEAQGSVSLSVSRILDTLDPNHTAARLGDRATLVRADRHSLATVVPDGLVYTKDFRSLILEGYLADIEAYDVETNLVITREQIVALQQQAARAEQEGTINHPSDAALIKLLKDSNRFQQAYRSWMDITEGVLKTMIFAQSVQDA